MLKQQEPRCLASLADDAKMQEAYATGKDLYATMASEIYKMPYADCMEFYLDENDEPIKNRFGYFKNAIVSNLNRFKNVIFLI